MTLNIPCTLFLIVCRLLRHLWEEKIHIFFDKHDHCLAVFYRDLDARTKELNYQRAKVPKCNQLIQYCLKMRKKSGLVDSYYTFFKLYSIQIFGQGAFDTRLGVYDYCVVHFKPWCVSSEKCKFFVVIIIVGF